MKKIVFTLLSFFTITFSFAQNADELNQQSKELLKNNEIEKAIPILRKAAELGNGEAQYNLGYFLSSGQGTEKDIEEAIKWYKKSSDNGFNDGHYAMMMAYGNGQGVEQNSELAFQYALKCANNNDATCMWNVVNCYANGNGVKQNNEEFLEWIFKLCKLENPENLTQSGYITSSRLELARFYKKGQFVTKDLYQSYIWYLIYNEFKVDFSILQQQEVIDEIKALEKLLSKEQIKSSLKDAEKLLGRKMIKLDELYKTTL